MKTTIWYLCALINTAIAILHIIIIFVGARAYSYFGAGEWMASQALQGSPVPALITSGVTAVFLGFAAYNLAGAGKIRLPLVRLALFGITAVYLLRGLIVLTFPFAQEPVSTFDVAASLIAFAIGMLHALAFYQTYFSRRLT